LEPIAVEKEFATSFAPIPHDIVKERIPPKIANHWYVTHISNEEK
jgi:hypothetical protein